MSKYYKSMFTDLIELEELLRDHAHRLSDQEKLKVAIKLFDDSLFREDISSAWATMNLIEPIALKSELAAEICLRKVQILRLCGHVTECMKYIDFCHLHIEMNNEQKNKLLWEKQLLAFYVNLDLSTLEHLVFSKNPTFPDLTAKLQTFIAGRVVRNQQSVAWTWERIIANTIPEERYKNESLITAAEFISIMEQKGFGSKELKSIFDRDLNYILNKLDLFSRLITEAAIIKTMQKKNIHMATQPLLKRYKDLSLNLSDGKSRDTLGVLGNQTHSDKITHQLTAALKGRGRPPRSGLARDFSNTLFLLREKIRGKIENLFLFGLNGKDRDAVFKKLTSQRWQRESLAADKYQGHYADNILTSSFLTIETFSEYKNFLHIRSDKPFIDFNHLLSVHGLEAERYLIRSECPFHRNSFEQIYRLRVSGMRDYLLRIPIFKNSNKKANSVDNYARNYEIQKDLIMTRAISNEFDVSISEIIEFDNSHAIAMPEDGIPIARYWLEEEKENLINFYQRIMKTVWDASIRHNFFLGNILPDEILVDGHGHLTLLNINNTIRLRDNEKDELRKLIRSFLVKQGSDNLLLKFLITNHSNSEFRKLVNLHLKIATFLDPEDQSRMLVDYFTSLTDTQHQPNLAG